MSENKRRGTTIPPFTMFDKMTADMMAKYHPAFTAKPITKTLIVDDVLYKDGKRLGYGEQIEPLDDQTISIIQRIQREVDKATPEELKQLAQRYEALSHSLATPMNGSGVRT